jgi:hypothetical protein
MPLEPDCSHPRLGDQGLETAMSNHPHRSRKTIVLPAERYRLRDGIVEAFFATSTGYQPDYNARDWFAELDKCEAWAWRATKYQMGSRCVLVSVEDVSPNALRSGNTRPSYSLSFDLDGVPGNSNPKIKLTEGWRGTTNDRSVYAHGVKTIRAIKTHANGDIAVTVS